MSWLKSIEDGPGIEPEPTIKEVISERGPAIRGLSNLIALLLIIGSVAGTLSGHIEKIPAVVMSVAAGVFALGGWGVGVVLDSYTRVDDRENGTNNFD